MTSIQQQQQISSKNEIVENPNNDLYNNENYKIKVLIPIARYPPLSALASSKSSTEASTTTTAPNTNSTTTTTPTTPTTFQVQIKSAANIKDFPYLDFKPSLFGETLYSSHKYELLLTPAQSKDNVRIFLLRDSNQERVPDGVQIQRSKAAASNNADNEIQVRIKLQVSSYFYFQEAFRLQVLINNVVKFLSEPFQVFARKRKDVVDPWKKNYPEKRKSHLENMAVPAAKKPRLMVPLTNHSDDEEEENV